MGLSLAGKGLLDAALPASLPGRELLTNVGYSLGFMVVVLGRQQLYTENTLTAVVPTLHDPSLQAFAKLLRLWSVVLIANLVGTLLFAAAAAHTEMFSPEARQAFHTLGMKAAAPDFTTNFARAVPAGWLIALMVWLQPASGSARALVVLFVTYFVGLGELTHIIAGSADVGYVLAEGAVDWATYGYGFVLPTLLGNTIGGAVLVAALNHAQTKAEVQGR